MTSISEAEYAILAAAAYRRDPPLEGDVANPSGWTEVGRGPNGATDGLHYKVFTKDNELVISFRGTDSGLDRLFDLDDWPAALGKMSSQIQLALRTMFRTLFDISLHPGRLI
jgi:hypothetical protein